MQRAGSTPAEAWRRIAFLASAGAAGVHLGAIYPHLDEYAPAATFMLAAGVAQLGWALAVATTASKRVVLAGILGNFGIVALWLTSRTAGLPWGPEPWMREHIHATDALATALEVLVLIAALALMDERTPEPDTTFGRLAWLGVVTTLLVSAHDGGHEQLAAAATLALAFTAKTLVIAVRGTAMPRERRSREEITYRARVPVGPRPDVRAELGTGG